jgi:hypothetical protein
MSEKLKFEIGADLAPLEKSLNEASNRIKKFADDNKEKFEKFGKSVTDVGLKFSAISAGALAAVGALGMLAKNVGNVADRLLDLADITGMTTDAIQEWQYVAKIAGVSTEAVTNATEGLVRRLKDVGEEGSPAVQVLRNLGIATKTSSGEIRNAGDVVDETIMKLSNMENVTERNTIGSQLFGGAWKDIAPILALGGDSIAQLRDEAQSLGLVMSNESLQSANAFRQGVEKITAKFEALKNQIGAKLAPILTNTLLPAIEKYLIPAFEKLADFVGKAIEWFQGLDPTIKKVIAVVGGLLIAIGPLLVAIGGIIQFMPILISGFAALTGPVGLIVLGITALTVAIVKNWDTIKKWAQDLVNYFINLYNKSIFFRGGIEGLVLVFKNVFAVAKFVFNALVQIVSVAVTNIRTAFSNLGDLITAIFTFDLAGIKKALTTNFTQVVDNTKKAFNNIGTEAKALFNQIEKNKLDAIQNVISGQLQEVDFTTKKESTEKLKNDVSNAVSEGVSRGLTGQGSGRQKATTVNAGMQASGVEALPSVALFTTDGLTEFREKLSEEAIYIQNLMMDLDASINDLIENSIANTFMSLGDAIGNALAGSGNVLNNLGNALLQAMGSFLKSLGGLFVKYGTAALFFDKVKKSLATGIGTPAAAAGLIAAGVVLGAIGSAIGQSSSGGIGGGGGGFSGSTATAQTSNVSASSFAAERNSEVVFRISGNDLLGVLRRAENAENRIG